MVSASSLESRAGSSDQRPLTIDAKFPLEAVTALREAKTEDERKQAAARLRQDLARHIGDIADKYLIPGETQDLALMFVPSESVYAELHDGFDDVVQKAYRARVVIVSPSLLMLAIQVMQQILKDARMREAADEIRTEVGRMMDDLGRLRERVLKLQQHYGQASEDMRQILVSAEKIGTRASRIDELDFSDSEGATSASPALRLEAGEAGSDGLEALANGLEMVQSRPETEIGQVVGDQLVAQEGGELFILLEERVLEVGAEDMMTVLDAVDDGGQLAAHLAVQARAKDLGDLVGGQPPQAELAAALEQLVDGKVALKDKVAAILDLGDRIKA